LALLTELANLEIREAELENKLQSLTEKEKTLKENVKALEVKVAIQKLEEKVKAKREAVEKLELRKSDLEKESKEPAISETTDEREPEGEQKVEEEQEKDSAVAMVSFESEEPAQSQELYREGKKKHKFFYADTFRAEVKYY
jgi:hypothetical protein